MKRFVAAPLALASSYGWAQQLVAVAPPADGSGFAVIAAVLVAGAGLVYLKVKRPEVLARLSSKVRALVKRRSSASSSPPPDRIEPLANVEFVQQPTVAKPIYEWLVAENERQRRRIAELEAERDAIIPNPATQFPAPTLYPQPSLLPSYTVGFLKA